MTHEDRLQLLADALLLSNPREVVPTLRAKRLACYGQGGALLFACTPDWSDERLVAAAVHVFVYDGVTPLPPDDHSFM